MISVNRPYPRPWQVPGHQMTASFDWSQTAHRRIWWCETCKTHHIVLSGKVLPVPEDKDKS